SLRLVVACAGYDNSRYLVQCLLTAQRLSVFCKNLIHSRERQRFYFGSGSEYGNRKWRKRGHGRGVIVAVVAGITGNLLTSFEGIRIDVVHHLDHLARGLFGFEAVLRTIHFVMTDFACDGKSPCDLSHA